MHMKHGIFTTTTNHEGAMLALWLQDGIKDHPETGHAFCSFLLRQVRHSVSSLYVSWFLILTANGFPVRSPAQGSAKPDGQSRAVFHPAGFHRWNKKGAMSWQDPQTLGHYLDCVTVGIR